MALVAMVALAGCGDATTDPLREAAFEADPSPILGRWIMVARDGGSFHFFDSQTFGLPVADRLRWNVSFQPSVELVDRCPTTGEDGRWVFRSSRATFTRGPGDGDIAGPP